MTGQVKVKKALKSANSPIEQAGEMLREPVKQVAELPRAIFDEALEQIGIKPKKTPLSGTIDIASGRHTTSEYSGGHAVQKNEQQRESAVNRQFQTQRSQEKVVFSQKSRVIENQIEKLMQDLSAEIRRLQNQTSELSAEVKNITVEFKPAKAGQYHVNFFEWLILEIRNIRRKVSDSRMWLQATYAKKQKRGFWQMAKKHGNNFLMSGERTPSGGAG